MAPSDFCRPTLRGVALDEAYQGLVVPHLDRGALEDEVEARNRHSASGVLLEVPALAVPGPLTKYSVPSIHIARTSGPVVANQ
jgi:hypothetical protein